MDRRYPRISCWRSACTGFLVCFLGLVSAQVHAQDTAPAPPAPGSAIPIDSAVISDVFDPLPGVQAADGSRWQAALATLPDPVESRLGRSFDILVATLIRNFQFNDYVLQGHAMPWPLQADNAANDKTKPYRDIPGVLVFRRDAWREDGSGAPGTRYFVVYLVGESPTFGVQRLAFCRAARQVAALNAAGTAPARTMPQGCPTAEHGITSNDRTTIPVLGPSFSGSINSLATVAKQANLHLELLSPSATVASNSRIDQRAPDDRYSIHYRTFVQWDQPAQMRHLFSYLRTVHDICPGDVAVLAEESIFGAGSNTSGNSLASEQTAPNVAGPCDNKKHPTYLQFPQNIAAIRAEHARIERDASTQAPHLPRHYLELDLSGTAASPDLPPVYQPLLSTRSDELSLQQLMDALRTFLQPKAVMVVATDIRDRLFMLSVVRRLLPDAMPIALEGDHLLAHPDYRRANRGTLMVANGSMLLCYEQVGEGPARKQRECRPGRAQMPDTLRRFFAFPTDHAANLFRANQYLLDASSASGANQATDGARSSAQRSPLSVVTLAGLQDIAPTSYGMPAERARPPGGILIAADFRVLMFNTVLPLLAFTAAMALLASVWLLLSSRPGRSVLPPLRYALRETGWRLDRLHQRTRADATDDDSGRVPAPLGRRFYSASHVACLMLLALAGVAFVLFCWRWGELLFTASWPHALRGVLQLIHGRDPLGLWALFGLYLWFAGLVATRLRSWNARCAVHAVHAPAAFEADRYLGRRYTRSAWLLALASILPPLGYWSGRAPQSVDGGGIPGLLALATLGLGVFFLCQGLLQTGRLMRMARDLRDHVITPLPKGALPDGWPTPQWLGAPPRSPLAAVFHDEDWLALDQGHADWPKIPSALAAAAIDIADPRQRLTAWRAQTVAEMRFGLTTARSCLWAGFGAPTAVLAMEQVFPFALEMEQSAVALGLMALVFAVTAWLGIALERAPLIGQMFTQDAQHISPSDLLRMLGTKLLLLLLALAATLTPDLGNWLQSLVGALRM